MRRFCNHHFFSCFLSHALRAFVAQSLALVQRLTLAQILTLVHNLTLAKRLILTVLLCASLPTKADAEYLLVLSSQRNAETIAEAVYFFNQRYPNLAIKARSDSQLWQMTAQDRQALIHQSRGLLGFGLYGPSVADLTPDLKNYKNNQLLINSDHRLVALSQIKGQRQFESPQHLRALAKASPGENFQAELAKQISDNPKQSAWLMARAYWQAGGVDNTTELFAWFYQSLGTTDQISSDKTSTIQFQPPKATTQLRWLYQNQQQTQLVNHVDLQALAKQSLVAVIDHRGGSRPADRMLLEQFCDQIEQAQLHCLSALAFWGEAGVKAAQQLQTLKPQLSAVVMLQDFVIGAGEGRARVNEVLATLNVPVLKAIKVRDRSAIERRMSADGLSQDKVYYQVAMPELQGASQPLVIANASEARIDALSGIRVQGIEADISGIESLVLRLTRWQSLQRKDNFQKRVGIIYYNHPPGRHNIGADNLDVPASLWQILQDLKHAGYDTGELPESQAALLDLIQQRGINLPRDAQALDTMAGAITTMSPQIYTQWFKTLPETVRREMQQGPFGLLHEQIVAALKAGKPELADDQLHHTFEEMHHLLEGVNHPARARALLLAEKLELCYLAAVDKGQTACLNDAPGIIGALQKTGIEGLGGWGQAPGRVMVHKNKILLPGLQFGKIFIGPQPPRGWEINEELLHANLAFPPPHQYLAFYHYLRNIFNADALVHLGRHSTYEFLPRRSVGLAEDDYSRIIAGDLPGIYPYIVDGVGEGIQAKRRGLAVMVDHLTPPLASTPLYDELLQLRQLVESFEASHSSSNKSGGNEAVAERLVKQIRDKVQALELEDEMAAAMADELTIMGISFDQLNDDMLVHEVGHYLTDLQERFMPLGLHIFGKDWSEDALTLMLESMTDDDTDKSDLNLWENNLKASPEKEIQALLNGLNGGYILPGQGNDPIRSPDSLPTGRNFFALDSSLIPSPVAWQLGQEMAQAARRDNPQDPEKSEALILWASDVVRDEGVMIAFGLDMLGLKPIWNSRGLVKGLTHQKLENNRVRRDTVFTTSGLFRDLYGQQMLLLNRANLMALDASRDVIRRDYPALSFALSQALAPLGKEAKGGQESLAVNQVAAHWVKQAKDLLQRDVKAEKAGVIASQRVFGDAPGSYGAGINRLVERSGAWQERSQLASVYLRRLGHSYGLSGFGAPSQKAFESVLSNVQNTYFGRSSNLYGLIDNNDAFDYLGGLSLSIETLTGRAPNNFVIDHSDPGAVKTRPLALALRQELRGRFLNPEWLKGLMAHDYAGARTMGSEFLEYLWGWQVTNPTLVGDWAWQEVKAVYMDDKYQLGLSEFLEKGHNAHVKANMLAIMLVAIEKGFWQADAQTTKELAENFARLVQENGLPGSGHTDPDNPMLAWLENHLSEKDWQALNDIVEQARPESIQNQQVHRISELEVKGNPDNSDQYSDSSKASDNSQSQEQSQNQSQEGENSTMHWPWYLFGFAVLVLSGGFYRAKRSASI